MPSSYSNYRSKMFHGFVRISILNSGFRWILIAAIIVIKLVTYLGTIRPVQDIEALQLQFVNICANALEHTDPSCCSSTVGRYKFLSNASIAYNDVICITDSVAIGKSAR